eukprot:13522796-Heterocapsa_arctica.AAC.1
MVGFLHSSCVERKQAAIEEPTLIFQRAAASNPVAVCVRALGAWGRICFPADVRWHNYIILYRIV